MTEYVCLYLTILFGYLKIDTSAIYTHLLTGLTVHSDDPTPDLLTPPNTHLLTGLMVHLDDPAPRPPDPSLHTHADWVDSAL